MHISSYVRRHFRRISRTSIVCVVVTCVVVLHFNIPSIPLVYGTTRETIRKEGGLSPENLFNKTSSMFEESSLPSASITQATRDSQVELCKTFTTWRKSSIVSCESRFILYATTFARLIDVVVDKGFCVSTAKGGEEIHEVFNRAENTEYINTKKGCFSLSCPSGVNYGYFPDSRNYLSKWLRSIKTDVENHTNYDVMRTFTIAIERRDYANIYWSMNDWYAAFLMMTFFNQSAPTTNILFVDAHPKTNLDPVWSTLFNSSFRFSEISKRILFADMVWGLPGYKTALVQSVPNTPSPPLLEEFRTFFLTRHRVEPVSVLDCQCLSILFSWRHNYVAHPRNPHGNVQRKIANEEQLITSVRTSHPSYKVTGVQMDLLSMEEQLRLVTQADIVIGMHGAGLAHVLMMQKQTVLIELVPNYYGKGNNHFADLARWRGVSYIKWTNTDKKNEKGNFMTRIPLSIMESLLSTAVSHICSGNTRRDDEPLYVVNGVNARRTNSVSFLRYIPFLHNLI